MAGWIWYHQSKQWSVREFVTRPILPFKSVIALQINYKYYYYFSASIFGFRRFLVLSLFSNWEHLTHLLLPKNILVAFFALFHFLATYVFLYIQHSKAWEETVIAKYESNAYYKIVNLLHSGHWVNEWIVTLYGNAFEIEFSWILRSQWANEWWSFLLFGKRQKPPTNQYWLNMK